jgi:hypothetical protein
LTEAATARRYPVVRKLRDRPTDTSGEPFIFIKLIDVVVTASGMH